jgi:hypothetical protein
MCISAAVIAGAALVASATGAAVSISSAKTNARMQKYSIDQQNKQIKEDREIALLQAQEAEAARLEEFRRQRAANLAAVAGSGVGQNISFLEGIAPAEERALRLDLRNIRMGNLMQRNRMADQIKVNQLSRQVAGINARNQTIGAVAGFVGDAASIGNSYNDTRGA